LNAYIRIRCHRLIKIKCGQNGKFRWLSILLLVLSITGCGYHLQATDKPMGGLQIDSLSIPLMASPSSSLGFEGYFTEVIRREFLSQSKIPFAPKDKAAAVLIGHVREIRTEPVGYRSTSKTVKGRTYNYETTSSRWLIMKLDAKLLDRKTGKIIWAEKSMEERVTYNLGTDSTGTPDPLKTRYNQKKATEKIAQLFAQRFYLKTMERF
jgi:outer membrane lipopolysaccharide assembly protein LptE/RlpB